MFPVPLVTSSGGFTAEIFWKVIMLYYDRPYLVNKLVTGTTPLSLHKIDIKSSLNHISELFTKSSILYERRKLENLSKEIASEDFIRNLVESYDKNFRLTETDNETFMNAFSGIFISLQLLISRRNAGHRVLELAIFDKNKNSAIIVGAYENSEDVLTPNFPYEFELNGENLRINLQHFEDADTRRAEWLADILFPKLLKWSKFNFDEQHVLKPLSLIALDEYCIVYDRLKKTYVEGLLKDWLEKTNMDPQKYIFEDLAISSYLICLWKKYPKDEISFVDCGCGNGLLVYILNQEGFKGYGIDIRRRNIWDVYPEDVRLEVGTVTPDSTFPDSTWLIGNHSDELTPWIPILALKSSKKTNFFVLPCCPYDFSGKKYIRTNINLSAYSDYLLYIEGVCKRCEFKVDIDKLRIPSTRNMCLVGVNQCDTEEKLSKVLEDIELFVGAKMGTEFKPRNATEVVRNCTQLNRELTNKLVSLIVDLLLKEENLIKKKDGTFWNKGSGYPISLVVQGIPKEYLKELKLQGKGIQTLMKNFRYIFDVTKGTVCLRVPMTCEATKGKYREKPCWFHKNHPQGCYNDAEDCCSYHV